MLKLAQVALLAALGSVSQTVLADTVYVGGGLNGINLGYSRSITDSIAGRVDLSFLPKVDWEATANTNKNFVSTSYSYRTTQLGLLADWYVASQFRLVGGLMANDTKITGTAQAGSTGTINGKLVTINSNDVFRVTYKLPTASPYVGVGWGGKPNLEKGWGFRADVGIAIGKGKTNIETSLVGTKGLTQADMDAELAKVRDKQSSVWPTALFGVSYRF